MSLHSDLENFKSKLRIQTEVQSDDSESIPSSQNKEGKGGLNILEFQMCGSTILRGRKGVGDRD